jgi:hypothetical protein
LDKILPLLETAFGLLEAGGHFCLSHVPRFCLPRPENDNATCTSTTTTTHNRPIEDLEDYIVTQALAQGFQLQETIRPDQVLMELPLDSDDNNDNDEEHRNFETFDDWNESSRPLTLKTLRQAHAVLFLFVKN